MDNTGKAPWHLWVVGLVSLLWNAFGGYDYTMSQLRDRAYLEATMGPLGMSADQAIAFLDSFPVWANALWALGVWGSLAGSILLLLRSRFAVAAYLVSLIGAVLSFAYQFTIELPPQMDTAMSKIMPLVIIAAVVLQWWYARSQKAAGVLR